MSRGQKVTVGGIEFDKKGDAKDYLNELLKSYEPGDRVSQVHTDFLMEAIKGHPDYDEKFGSGVERFYTDYAEFGTVCFWAALKNGEPVKFSAKSLVPVKKRKK